MEKCWIHSNIMCGWDSKRLAQGGYNLEESIKLVYNCNEWNKIRAIKAMKEDEQKTRGKK